MVINEELDDIDEEEDDENSDCGDEPSMKLSQNLASLVLQTP